MRKLIVSASVVAHGAGIAALTIMAFWRIDKLPLADTPVRAAFSMPGMPAPAGGPKGPDLVAKKPDPEKQPRTKVKDLVQPQDEIEKTQTDTGATTATSGTDEGGLGGGEGPDTGESTTPIPGDGTCTTPPCDGEEPPVVVVKKKKPPVTITPDLANGLRTAGNAQIHAPEQTRVTMLHEGKTQVVASVKLCIGDDGGIDSIKLMKSTGYADYDAKITGEMRGWRYTPYKVNGEAVPFCTAVTIVYKMKK